MKAYFFRSERRKQYLLHRLMVVNLVFLLFYLSGCAHLSGRVTYYDPITYKSLTDLKPEVIVLYETFTSDSVDTGKIAAIRLKLAQMKRS